MLYLVTLTPMNTAPVRTYVVEQLRHTAASTGVGQAALLSDTAAKSIGPFVEGSQMA